tara:strand:+ start:1071 stop:2288 length:1218 start_codon:yes stop_codon:yes gene_type:complete
MSPDKKKAAAATKKATDAAKDDTKGTTPSSPSPAPLETPVVQQTPATSADETATDSSVADSSSAATDSSVAATRTSSSADTVTTSDAGDAPSTVTIQPEKPTASTATEPTAPTADATTSQFEKCLQEKSSAIVATLKAIEPREPTPSNFLSLKDLLLKSCESKLENKANSPDSYQLEASKLIASETLKAFPKYEPIVKFFNAIENNTTLTPEQKENIYKYYGSGGEISSKDIHFYGKLEGSKASPNVISYLITSATGTRTTRVFTNNKEIKKTVTDLKSSPKTTNRYTFDFSPTQNNTYTLNISNGEAKLVVNVTFIKGDIKTLRERKAVIVALTAESWSKVQEEHLRRLISSEAKELISMPFALEREQTNMALVRTCSLDADYIACTDPDFTSRAVVKASAKAK